MKYKKAVRIAQLKIMIKQIMASHHGGVTKYDLISLGILTNAIDAIRFMVEQAQSDVSRGFDIQDVDINCPPMVLAGNIGSVE